MEHNSKIRSRLKVRIEGNLENRNCYCSQVDYDDNNEEEEEEEKGEEETVLDKMSPIDTGGKDWPIGAQKGKHKHTEHVQCTLCI